VVLVVVVFSTIDSLDTVHLRLVSLAVFDAVMRLGKQVIIIILQEKM
jgi:hypothetical protein